MSESNTEEQNVCSSQEHSGGNASASVVQSANERTHSDELSDHSFRSTITVNSEIFMRVLFIINFAYAKFHAITVSSEIFVRVLFSGNFAYAKFREVKSSRNHSIDY